MKLSEETKEELKGAAKNLPDFIKMVDKLTSSASERELTYGEKGNLYAHSKLLSVDARYAGSFNVFFTFYVACMAHNKTKVFTGVLKNMADALKTVDEKKFEQVTEDMISYMLLDMGEDKLSDILSKIVNKD